MSDIVSPLLQWLNTHPELAGLVTFIISAGESVAIIGTIVPGSIMMTALGTLAGAGIIPLWGTIFWAIIGAIVGDSISYWIGHYFKLRLPKVWPFRYYPNLLKSGEQFFKKYGSMSVFIGRFVGPVRALVPLVAGMLGMRPLKFTIANVTSAIGWAPAYMLPGILLGAASLELPPDIAVHFILVLFLIALFIMLCLWFIYKLFQLIQKRMYKVQNNLWKTLKNSRYFSSITVLLQYHNNTKKCGQLTLAFYFIVTTILFFCLAFYVKLKGPAYIPVNDAMFHLFRGLSIRSSTLDNVMIDITLLGQKQVLLPLVIVLFAWLVFSKRWRAALHALALSILAAGSVLTIKHILKVSRPWGILTSPETYSMPSGHTTLGTAVYMGLAFLIATSLKPKHRWLAYTLGSIITFAIAISRLYLGAHWFTDVLGGLLISTALLILVIISYQRQIEKPINPLSITGVGLATLFISLSVYHYLHFPQLKTAYTQMSWPTDEISLDNWWQNKSVIPAYHTSLFGFPSEQINIQWLGNINQIKETLVKEGWSKPPARDWISTLHRIADVSSTQYLPMISPQYLDKRPTIIMTRRAANLKSLLVIRLWNANRYTTNPQTTLWVGIVGTVPRSYSWLFTNDKNNNDELSIDPSLVFPAKTGIGLWQWKIVQTDFLRRKTAQKIMLIRQNKFIYQKK